MSVGIAPQMFNLAEPIPGYLVRERLGAGGYGEVWRAEAPGGIAKAIKVVYGRHDDERATRELTSLNRIKEVRHPFLLSLERIELVDRHLIIVTELATSSMKNQFDLHRQSGLIGIPRGELLRHLRDAADALDYISQQHSLQHLDVKPENLLFVGGRIKVADFGLVKDLQDVNCSVMGGLTPVYAAPELFDGRPNNHSDQYSLAIVYQEMLTGELPFDGRTTAQLASQHLHSRPKLDRLPLDDQAVIARALSKDPEKRYPSCREMVECLLDTATHMRPRAARTPLDARGFCPPLLPPIKTEALHPAKLPAGQPAAGCMTQPTEPEPAVRDLAPLNLKAEDAQYRPTVFVGIGGLAANVLQALQRRLFDRFGDVRGIPAWQLLLFETDPETVKQVTEGEGPAALPNDSAVLLPLRQAAEYRRESNHHLQWLSRRWIFNIPRSLQTHGLRPLGRLALVDHMDRVREQLTRAIREAAHPQSLETSSAQTGFAFRGAAPRICIVSSISGGTGGGMALDIAFLARKILGELELPDDAICGVLAHCAGRHPQARDLAVANAYAFLEEMNHYSELTHAYPGDASCGLQPFSNQIAPFDHAYVVNLGEELDAADFAAGAEKLAAYLYYGAATPAAGFFDKCRAQPVVTESCTGIPTARTFGLKQLGFSYEDIPSTAADELCAHLVLRWRGAGKDEDPDRPTSLANPNSLLANRLAVGISQEELRSEAFTAVGLDIDKIVAQLYAEATLEMNDDPEAYLLTVLEELAGAREATGVFGSRLPSSASILDALDTIIRSQDGKNSSRVCLEAVLEKYLERIATRRSAAVRDWILELVASPKHRVEGAQRAADAVAEHLRALIRQAEERVQGPRREIHALEQSLLTDKNGSRDWLRFRGWGSRRRLVADPRLLKYFRLRIDALMHNGVCRLAGLILAQVATCGDKLRNLAADLNRLGEDFQRQAPAATAAQSPNARTEALRPVLAAMIEAHTADLVQQMETDLENELRRVATTEDHGARRALPLVLCRKARQTLLKALKNFTMQEILASDESAEREPLFSLSAAVQAAKPGLADCGGARRLLLVAPEDYSPTKLAEQLDGDVVEPPTMIAGTESDVLLCYEVEQLSLRRVAASILNQRFQNVETASRLHTRIDVAWSPL